MYMPELIRTLTVGADGQDILSFNRAHLSGRDALGLLPQMFMLCLWNLSESDYLMLSRAKKVTVRRENSVLAFGTVTDAHQEMTPDGLVTRVVFSSAIDLWEAGISLSLPAGASVSETVRALLEASGTGLSLLAWMGEDPVFSRGQAFFGRAAECISSVLSAVHARGYLTENGLGIVPDLPMPVSMVLSSSDLIDTPSFAAGGLMILRTSVTGWPLGKRVRVQWDRKAVEGIIIERGVDADNVQGKWEAELLIEVVP